MCGLQVFAVLMLGSLAGMRLATPLIGRIPDRLHARICIGLLALVAMRLNGLVAIAPLPLVGASVLAMVAQAPRGIRCPALS